MSIIPPGLGRLLHFYLSGPAPCPYLDGRVERKLFTRLVGDPAIDSGINAALTRAGFRRSHEVVYRPACPSCSSCVPVRVPVARFAPSRSLRRVASLNRTLALEIAPARGYDKVGALYPLFARYQESRHAGGDMARMTEEEFSAMIAEGAADTELWMLRAPPVDGQGGPVMGVAIVDRMKDGFSAVYSFFAPDEPRRSLGAQLILTLIAEAARLELDYVYLGYWIRETRKMAYKTRFQPLEALGPEGWKPLTLDAPIQTPPHSL